MRAVRTALGIVGAVGLLMFPLQAWGIDLTPDEITENEEAGTSNSFYKRSLNHMGEPHKKGGNQSVLEHHTEANDRWEFRSRANPVWRDWTGRDADTEAPSEEGTPGSVEESDYLKPDDREDYVNVYAPVQGALMGLHGEGYRDAIKNGMEGAVPKMMIALAQTEPGIFAGVSAAERIVAEKMALFYDAEEQMLNSMPENEWMRQRVITAYNACISEKQPEEGWLQAAYSCMGDNNETPDQIKVDTISPTEDWKAKEHPDKEVAENLGTDDEREMSVVDQIFNRDASADGSKKKAEFERLADSFKKWFGDYKITFDEPTLIGDRVYSQRIYREEKILPDEPFGKEVNKITTARYKDAIQLMGSLCQHYEMLGAQQENATTSGRTPVATEGQDNYFWNESILGQMEPERKMTKRLSIPGLSLHATAFNAIWELYLQRHGPKVGNEDWENTPCTEVFDWSNASPDLVRESERAGSGKYLEFYTLLYDYAKFVAVDQVLRAMREAELFVMRRSAGTDDRSALTRDAALELIYSVARVDDLEGARLWNVSEMEQYVYENIHDKISKESGNLGKNVGGAFRADGTDKMTAAGN